MLTNNVASVVLSLLQALEIAIGEFVPLHLNNVAAGMCPSVGKLSCSLARALSYQYLLAFAVFRGESEKARFTGSQIVIAVRILFDKVQGYQGQTDS